MRTNIVLDEQLVSEAFKLTGIKTKRELILQALKEMVENRKRLNLRDLKGAGGFHRDYDYKALRINESGQ
ncbi:MAG: type II toxin-antitoxin system VapB family antitoxin [Candidatus Thiothrix moscowensis]|nr:type II toxin-antitoxin system VapB family antitoxin [Candidatus Thiothrix moscowensis]